MAEADARGETMAVAESDVGNFKVVNDELGHDVGDAILKAEAEAIHEGLRMPPQKDRPGDFAGNMGFRVGGDEFPALLRSIDDPAQAQVALDRVNSIFDQKVAAIIGDKLPKEAFPFIAWGTELRKPGDTRPIEELRKAADANVMANKNAVKAQRGIPATREGLTAYLQAHRSGTATGVPQPGAPQSPANGSINPQAETAQGAIAQAGGGNGPPAGPTEPGQSPGTLAPSAPGGSGQAAEATPQVRTDRHGRPTMDQNGRDIHYTQPLQFHEAGQWHDVSKLNPADPLDAKKIVDAFNDTQLHPKKPTVGRAGPGDAGITPEHLDLVNQAFANHLVNIPTGMDDMTLRVYPGQEKAGAAAATAAQKIAKQRWSKPVFNKPSAKVQTGGRVLPKQAKDNGGKIKALLEGAGEFDPKTHWDGVAIGEATRDAEGKTTFEGIDTATTTDGRQLLQIHDPAGFNAQPGLYREGANLALPKAGGAHFNEPADSLNDFPSTASVTAEYKKLKKANRILLNPSTDIPRMRQLAAMMKDTDRKMAVMARNPDGSLGWSAESSFGQVEIGLQDGAVPLMAVDPNLVRRALELHAVAGGDNTVEAWLHQSPKKNAMLYTRQKAGDTEVRSVTMGGVMEEPKTEEPASTAAQGTGVSPPPPQTEKPTQVEKPKEVKGGRDEGSSLSKGEPASPASVITPKDVSAAYLAEQRDSSMNLQSQRQYARGLALVAHEIQRKGWAPATDFRGEVRKGKMDALRRLPGILDKRWDINGNTYYALAGTPPKPDLYTDEELAKAQHEANYPTKSQRSTEGGGGGAVRESDTTAPPSNKTPKETGETPMHSGRQGPAVGKMDGQPFGAALRGLEMPELVRMANELMGGSFEPGKMKVTAERMGRMRAKGFFQHKPGMRGEERIAMALKTFADPRDAAATMAHELGHLVDFLPDAHIHGRGNIIGRITSFVPVQNAIGQMRGYLKNAFGPLVNKQLRKELIALSEWWSPYDPRKAPPSYIKYRQSPEELYAEALSVLLNSPGDLEARARNFYRALLDHIDKKPEFVAQYVALQGLLAGDPQNLYQRRAQDVRDAYARGEDILRAQAAEKAERRTHIGQYVYQLLFDKAAPLVRRENLAKAAGKTISMQASPRFAMEELALADNRNHTMLDDIQSKVVAPLLERGIDIEDLGQYLMFDRIANGGRSVPAPIPEDPNNPGSPDPNFDPMAEENRSEMANPFGHTPETARDMLEGMKEQMIRDRSLTGADDFKALQDAVQAFHDIIWKSVEEAATHGTYSQERVAELAANKNNYATFAVLDHLTDHIPAAIIHQVGTLKPVANPFVSTVMKTITLNRVNELQKAKNKVRDFLKKHFPEDIAKQEPRVIVAAGGRRVNMPPRVSPDGMDALTILEDGKPVHYDVDQYIAKAFQLHDVGMLQKVGAILQALVYKPFHALFVTYNPAWQVANYLRDFDRTYVNLSEKGRSVTLGGLLKAYWGAMGPAWRRARGLDDATVRAMVEDKSLDVPFVNFGFDDEQMQYQRLLERHGLGEPAKARTALGRAVHAILHAVEVTGIFSESLPKIAAWQWLERNGVTGELRSWTVRNLVGTPNIRKRGLASTPLNGAFMYAKIQLAGLSTDARQATQPSTRGGWWFKMAMLHILPKVLLRGAALGVFGAALKKAVDLIGDYDKANYIIIPMGMTHDEKTGQDKAIYARIPQDETARHIGGLAWQLLQQNGTMKHMQDLLNFEHSQLMPNLSPPLQISKQWTAYLTGNNPQDDFFRKNVVSDAAWKAGGWYAFKDMARWTLDQFGIASIMANPIVESVFGPRPGESKQTTLQTVISTIPGLNRMLKMSDKGLSEQQTAELNLEDQEKARFALDLPQDARNLVRERYRLNRLGDDKLTQQERQRRAQVNDFYNGAYLPLTKEMWELQQLKDPKYDRTIGELKDRLKDLAQQFKQ